MSFGRGTIRRLRFRLRWLVFRWRRGPFTTGASPDGVLVMYGPLLALRFVRGAG